MAQFRNYKFVLAANQEITPTLEGNFLHCFEATATFEARPDSDTPVQMQKGIGVDFGKQFKSVRITNGATAQTIELYAGDGYINDNRLVTSGGVQINGNSAATYGAVTVGVAATLVLAANTERSQALITNNSGSVIYIGVDNAVLTTTGIPVGAGQSFNATFKTDIYAISAAAGLDVRYLQETNS